MSTKPIHIALTFDDRYWAPAYTVMRSICLFTFRRKDVQFHLFHRTLTAEHRAQLETIVTEFGATQHFYDIDNNAHFVSIASRARHNERLSNIVYARILFAEILPAEVARVLYLDCDMLVRAPIERLYDIDMRGFPLAAVPDYFAERIVSRRNLVDPRGIFDVAMRYFNAGMLLIDMDKWRELAILDKFEAAIASGLLDRIYYDQDFLNLTFRENWLELHQYWNLHDPLPVHQQLNPYILHYTGEQKPWRIRPRVAFARVYRHVMTNDVYYKYLRERCPAWQRPLFRFVERMNKRTGTPDN
jgi:lipopolysaccharide biosynthesis glycosyltransferase